MITVSSTIPAHNAASNPASIAGSTDAYIATAGTAGVYAVEFPINPSVDDSFTLHILGLTLTFVAKTTPDSSGYQFKRWNDSTTWNQMIEDLKKNYYLDRYFNITHTFSTGELAFTEKVPGETKLLDEYSVVGSINISITVAVDTAYELGYKTICEVHLQESKSAAPENNLKASYELVPNEDETFTFNDISDGLKTIVSAAPPQKADTSVEACAEMLNFFNLRLVEEYGYPVRAMHSITVGEADNYPRAYYGGIHQRKHGVTAAAYSRHITETYKPFLTYLPQGFYVTTWQPVALYVYVAGGVNTLNRRFTVYYTDGTSTTFTNSSTSITNDDGCIYRVWAGHDQSALADATPSKNIWKYEFWLEDDSNARITEKRLFHVHRRGERNKEYIYFENPLGTYDSVAITGLGVIAAEVESKNEKLLYPATTHRSGNYLSAPREKFYNLTLLTGLLRKTDAVWMQDILHSKKVIYWNTELEEFETLILTNKELAVWSQEANFNSYALQFNISRTE